MCGQCFLCGTHHINITEQSIIKFLFKEFIVFEELKTNVFETYQRFIGGFHIGGVDNHLHHTIIHSVLTFPITWCPWQVSKHFKKLTLTYKAMSLCFYLNMGELKFQYQHKNLSWQDKHFSKYVPEKIWPQSFVFPTPSSSVQDLGLSK